MKSILFLVNPSSKEYEEMDSLLSTAGYKNINVFYQNINEVNKSFYIGSGKVNELKEYLLTLPNLEDMTIVFNVELNMMQKRNLEDLLEVGVLDRTELIIEIFENNARTAEAKLQVEIAKLKYLSARLVNKEANYSQVTSGSGHNKGKGETQKELTKRQLSIAIRQREAKLKKIKNARKTARNRRIYSSIPVIAVVGYTNVGKSTLINSLIALSKKKPEKNVFVENRLFATLETSSRLIDIYNYPSFIITDTVGFISRLPHFLVKSFQSTLEEIKDADYILIVHDVSSQTMEEEAQITLDVLHELGANEVPIFDIYNKADRLTNVPYIKGAYITSFKNPNEMKDTLLYILDTITEKWEKKEIFVPYDFDLREFSKDNFVYDIKNKKDGMSISVKFNPVYRNKYLKYFIN